MDGVMAGVMDARVIRVGMGIAISACAVSVIYVCVQFDAVPIKKAPLVSRRPSPFLTRELRPLPTKNAFLSPFETRELPPESLWELGGCDTDYPLLQCKRELKDNAKFLEPLRMATKNDFREGSLLDLRHDRCAVVGSSGNVLHYDLGKEIDEHNIVIRVNPPLSQFQDSSHFGKYVGRRHGDVIIFGASALRPGCPQLKKDQRYILTTQSSDTLFKNKIYFQFYEDCWKKYNLKTFTLNGVFRQKAERLAAFVRKQCPSNAMRHSITSGLTAIVFTLHLCHNVDLYGFGLNEANQFEYHRNVTREQFLARPSRHDWPTETRLLKYLTSNRDAVSKLMLDGFDPPNVRNRGASFDLPGAKVCVVK
ncbi:type 2 lactosamine alpha-2,3-sialyltransferase-like [Oscarella lobularis]|uniref:type 2 lactosamine alpha-2,3-sialyltransferase-like n=1 Tax=Oscarella lobularis TaxID=121494 RepID=UPI0033143DF4